MVHDRKADYTVECSQDRYVKQLRLMALDSLPTDEEALVEDKDLLSSSQSLVGGVAWTLLTRFDVAVHVGYLQRHAHAPRAKHF